MSWHRSLYWRIAIGFVLFLAAMLVVQAVLFTWVISRSGETVPGQSPRRFAPTLALVASGVLIVGIVTASVLIFGPPRRRLQAVELAARRLGSGDVSARAPEAGGDEIAAVAKAFNVMADDLAARERALLSSDKARRQLLADVSHEL